MSITPNVPPAGESEVYEREATPKWVPIVVVVLFLGLVGAVYAGYSSRTSLENELATANTKADNRADLMSKELEQTNERVAQLRGQLDVTSQKLGLTQDELARARTLAQTIQTATTRERRPTGGADRASATGNRHQDRPSLDGPDRGEDRHRVDAEGSERHQSQADLDRGRPRRAERIDCADAGRSGRAAAARRAKYFRVQHREIQESRSTWGPCRSRCTAWMRSTSGTP